METLERAYIRPPVYRHWEAIHAHNYVETQWLQQYAGVWVPAPEPPPGRMTATEISASVEEYARQYIPGIRKTIIAYSPMHMASHTERSEPVEVDF